MKVWEQGADFMAELKADPEVRAALSEAEIEASFDLGYHTAARRHDLRAGVRRGVSVRGRAAFAPAARPAGAGAGPRQPAGRGVAARAASTTRIRGTRSGGWSARWSGPSSPPCPTRRGSRRCGAARVGLWDVIASAVRPGSLDSGDPRRRSMPTSRGWSARLPELRAVGFNGGTAARIGRRRLAGVAGPALVDLPSSSPAHAGMPFAEKLRRWSVLGRYLALRVQPALRR